MGVASTAPAYSLAVTLGLAVVFVGLPAPIVAVLAFVPIFLTSIGYSALNKSDPDCGTTFTWATRAFGPKTGWVLLVGLIWLVLMTYICYRGNFDVLSSLGTEIFGGKGIGLLLARLLILMVLSSAAASTQTTILPTARTTLSMATCRAIPRVFAKMHPRYLTPTVSTIVMGVLSGLLYLWFNFTSGGFVISDAVTAIGLYIAFYYGLTAFACTWYYRRTLLSSQRNLWMQASCPPSAA